MIRDPEDFLQLVEDVRTGRLLRRSRRDLEKYALMVCDRRFDAYIAGPTEWNQVAEMIRLVLLVRISEDTQAKALGLSRVALVISIVAALLSAFQALSVFGVIRASEVRQPAVTASEVKGTALQLRTSKAIGKKE